MLYTPYCLPLILSAVVLASIAGIVLRFKSAPAVRAHMAAMLSGASWCLAYALAVSTSSLGPRVFLGNAAMAFALAASTSAFFLAMEFAGRGSRLTARVRAALVSLPSLLAVLIVTSPWHGLFHYGYSVDSSLGFASIAFSTGPLFFLFPIYQALLIASSVGALLSSAFRDRRERNTAFLLSVGIACPYVAELLFGLGLSPIPGFDLSPLFLVGTGVCTTAGLLSGRFLSVTLIARDLVIGSLPDLAIVIDERALVVDLNEAARRALGLSDDAAMLEALGRALPEPWAAKLGELAPGEPKEIAVEIGSERRLFLSRAERVTGGSGRALGELFLLRDITERARAEEGLRESEGNFRFLAETSQVGMYIYDGETLLFVNPAFVRITGYDQHDLAGVDPLMIIHPEELDILKDRDITGLGEDASIDSYETRLISRSGKLRWVELSIRAISYRGKSAKLGSLVDVTERKSLEESLRASQALYLGIVEDQIDPVCRWLPDTTLTFVNDAYCEYFGLSRGETLGRRFEEWLPESSRGIFRGAIEEIVRDRASTAVREELACTPEGKRRWMAWAFRPVKVEAGTVVEIQSVGRDITALKEAEEALSRANGELSAQLERNGLLQERLLEQAVRDVTTGLFNRRYLEETLDREVAGAERDGSSLCVIMLDLDHFKRVNDSYGHKAGDKALEAFGLLLRQRTRQMDVACRFGGEEFVVIMPNAELEMGRARAEELRLALESLEIASDGQPLRLTVSAGVACFPAHGRGAEALLAAADAALYAAKAAGRNNVQVYGGDTSIG
jgi:diguanylate cyclase (GGDEF)-like protein/PAS domain S-box-containing protein